MALLSAALSAACKHRHVQADGWRFMKGKHVICSTRPLRMQAASIM